MPTCLKCKRRVWIWQASLFGRPCTLCRSEAGRAREAAARERLAARRAAFEQAGPARRLLWGMRRGLVVGTFGLLAVAASLFAMIDGSGDYPFRKLSAAWVVLSLVAVGVAALVGWWLSSWLIGIACVLAIGAVGGCLIGGYQGLRGKWDLFAERP